MMRYISRLFVLVFYAAIFCSTLQADENTLGLFHSLPQNFSRSFTGYRLGLQLGGVATTASLSLSSADAATRRAFYSGKANGWANPAVYAAIILPSAIDGGLFLASRFRNDVELLRASFAGLQASIVALTYVSVLKFFTDRPYPGKDPAQDVEKLSAQA